MTFWSTLISTLVLLPFTLPIGALKSEMSFGKTLATQAVAIPTAVATEIVEELHLDPYIENWIKARFSKFILSEFSNQP